MEADIKTIKLVLVYLTLILLGTLSSIGALMVCSLILELKLEPTAITLTGLTGFLLSSSATITQMLWGQSQKNG
jgi:hypothetical protein